MGALALDGNVSKVFNIACVIFLATAFFTVIGRLLDSDDTFSPSISLLRSTLAEIAAPCTARGILEKATSKYPLIGVSKAYACAASKEEVEREYGVFVAEAKWILKEKQDKSDGTRLIYCRGRIALDLEIMSRGGQTAVDIGTYWTSDKGSSRYCSSKGALLEKAGDSYRQHITGS